MPVNNLTLVIGGEAGQGVESSGAGFAKALVRGGLSVFGLPDYRSRIRGGHNFYQIRISPCPVWTHTEPVHLALVLTETAARYHLKQLVPGGTMVYDEGLAVDATAIAARGAQALPMPLLRFARELGGNDLMVNTAALGAAVGLTGMDMAPMISVMEDNFGRKRGSEVAAANRRVAEAAAAYAREHGAAQFPWKIQTQRAAPRMVLNGNQAFSLGALLGGCKFVAGYPMTPASSVLEWMTAHGDRYGVVTKHTEDEIAAAAMVVGAYQAGVRAMTPTSGGGFCQMLESLGMAAMTETPMVIYEAMRPGPSTGMPTRTEQGDLRFVLHASQGEFPRLVLAPGTLEQLFEAGWRAFNLAERYQCPVIVLSDHHLAGSVRDLPTEALDFGAVRIDRGELLTDADLDALQEPYRRYAFTESGVSPWVIPGHPKGVYAATSDEHDEWGHIEEDAENRRRMMDKRMGKLRGALEEMRPPARYGPAEAEITFVGWGSSYGALRETVDLLNAEGRSANLLHIVDVWPFPAEATAKLLAAAKRTIAVEDNYSGQMADLIRQTTGHRVTQRILRYDGRAISPDYILAHLRLEGGR